MNPALADQLYKTLTQWENDPALKFRDDFFTRFPKGGLYLVGGAVRDAALGHTEQKDFDFVVRNVPAKELEKFLQTLGRVDLVGKSFGVYKFTPRGQRLKEAIDIALPRTEHAFGTGGYRAVDVNSNPDLPIEMDLERRDFTINAMALELRMQTRLGSSKLIDPFHGLLDLGQRHLRAVGTPQERFQEDYSRMLRALRFTCVHQLIPEKRTWEAIISLMPHINDTAPGQKGELERIVPYEIVAKELLKSLYANPVKAFDLFDESGAFSQLIPELERMRECPQPIEFHSEGDVWVHTRLALAMLQSPEWKREFPDDALTMQTIIAVLFHDIAKPLTIATPKDPVTDRYRYHGHDKIGGEVAKAICRRLKLSSMPRDSKFHVDGDNIQWLVAKHLLLLNSKIEEMKASTIEKYFFSTTVPGIELLQLILADSLATIPQGGSPYLEHFRGMKDRIDDLIRTSGSTIGIKRGLPPPLLGGNEIMEKFHLGSGPKIGKLLKIVREEQLKGRLTSKIEALERIREELGTERNAPEGTSLQLPL